MVALLLNTLLCLCAFSIVHQSSHKRTMLQATVPNEEGNVHIYNTMIYAL